MPEVMSREFGVRFNEAIDNLKGKLPSASIAWDDLAGPVHAKVFTVAGAITADLARDIQQAMTEAIANGTTITAFRKQFDEIVQRHGWTYRGKRGWRTGVIFDTNMRSAHMAGRWQQIEALASSTGQVVHLQYRTAGDARVRPQHRAWDGKIYPKDDSFWQTHYPPNGWGCRCTIRVYSQREMDRKGLKASEPFKVQTRDVVTRDGEIKDRVPVGIDPGWDHNVGKSWIAPELALGQKIASLPPQLRGVVADKSITPAFVQAMSTNWQAARSSAQPAVVGFMDSATLQAVADKVPTLSIDSTAMRVVDAAIPAGLDLPDSLRNYRAVLWDAVANEVVVVPQGQQWQAVRLRPNVASKLGTALEVQGVEDTTAAALSDGRYRVLVGRVR